MKQKQITLPLGIIAALSLVASLYSFADNTKAKEQSIQTAESVQEAQSEESKSEPNTSTQSIGSAWPGPL